MYMYIYSNKGKTNNIFKVKIFSATALSVHNLSLYQFRFESHIRLNSDSARYKVVQGTNRTRFNFYNKDW